MTGCKTLIAATLLSMTAVTSAGAQLPNWALSEPSLYQAQYPDRDFFNDGALTPAGRMGLELPGGAAPVFRPNYTHKECLYGDTAFGSYRKKTGRCARRY